MKHFHFIAALLAFTSLSSHAQVLTGKVTDSGSKPIEFANVLLLNAKDSTFITGVVTDTDGKFTIPAKGSNPVNEFLIKVSCIGYSTAFVKSQPNPVNIILSEATNSIKEVVIKGRAQAFKLTKEGITTNVAGTMLSRLGTGKDVLSHIPGVISTSGGYEVFGKGTPLIYINGRRIYNNTEVEELKSDNIKSVEVITSPGAKYGSQVYSVIKIKTKKPVGDGLGMTIKSNYSQGKYANFTEQLSWNYRHNRLDIFGSHWYGNSKSSRTADITLETDTEKHFSHSMHEVSDSRDESYYNNFGFNYQLNDSISLGGRYSVRLYPNNYSHVKSHTETTVDGNLSDLLDMTGRELTDMTPSHNANAYFAGKVGSVTLRLDLDYLHNKKNATSVSYEKSQQQDSRTINTRSNIGNTMYAGKLTADFHALASDITLGTEFTSSKRTDIYNNAEGYISSTNSKIEEKHLSPFAEMAWTLWGKSQLTAGVRYERIWSDYDENGVRIGEQSRRYGRIYPSISYFTSLGAVQLGLSYTGKNRLPSYSQLRSNTYYGNRYVYQSGNPNLKQEFRHNISLSGAWKFLQFSADYTDRRDAIIYSSDMYQGSSSITYISFENRKSLKNISLMLAASPTIGVWSPYFSAGLNKQWFNMKTKEGTNALNKPYAFFSLTNLFDLGHDWTAELDLSYTTKGYDENMHIARTNFTANACIYKYLLKKRLYIKAGINDMFRQKSGAELLFYRVRTTQIERTDSRKFYINAVYNFNASRSRYKGKGAGNSEQKRF